MLKLPNRPKKNFGYGHGTTVLFDMLSANGDIDSVKLRLCSRSFIGEHRTISNLFNVMKHSDWDSIGVLMKILWATGSCVHRIVIKIITWRNCCSWWSFHHPIKSVVGWWKGKCCLVSLTNTDIIVTNEPIHHACVLNNKLLKRFIFSAYEIAESKYFFIKSMLSLSLCAKF